MSILLKGINAGKVLEEIVEASINMDATCLTQIQNKYITFLATEVVLTRTLSSAMDNLKTY